MSYWASCNVRSDNLSDDNFLGGLWALARYLSDRADGDDSGNSRVRSGWAVSDFRATACDS